MIIKTRRLKACKKFNLCKARYFKLCIDPVVLKVGHTVAINSVDKNILCISGKKGKRFINNEGTSSSENLPGSTI